MATDAVTLTMGYSFGNTQNDTTLSISTAVRSTYLDSLLGS